MIADIKTAAEAVGITAVITNSSERIETQLNRIARLEEFPMMLVSWDLQTSYDFDSHGFLKNPTTDVTVLLMDKSVDNSKEEAENTAEEMEVLYRSFIIKLREGLLPHQQNINISPVFSITSKLAPIYGVGKHSGIVGSFTMSLAIDNC